MEILKLLQGFGLSEKESRIYLALSKAGASVVSDIAKKSSINRSTAYVLLESLHNRGLVNVSEKNNVQYFSTVSPTKFSDIAEINLKISREALKIAETLTRELSKTKTHAPLPTQRIFEGEEAILYAWQDFLSLKSNTNLQIIGELKKDSILSESYNRDLSKKTHKFSNKQKTDAVKQATFFINGDQIFYLPRHEEYAVWIDDPILLELISS